VSIARLGWYDGGSMGSEVFVDVTYRGLELGRRLKLREVGPSTAYLEHGTPMPVGSQVILATDEGLSIPVVVLRVHEQVAGAEMPPGMRVQAPALEGAAAGWWSGLVTREDPRIPELEVVVARPERKAPPPPPAEVAPPEEPPPVEIEAEDPEENRATTIMTAVSPPDEGGEEPAHRGNGKIDSNPARTMVMSAQEIKEAIGTDPSAPAPTDDDTGGNGEGGDDSARGKSRGRRRRRR
jgi:hypothetical protein